MHQTTAAESYHQARAGAAVESCTLHRSRDAATPEGFARTPEALCWADGRPPLAAPKRTGQVLNRYDHRSAPGEAEIRYLDGDFRVVRPGAFVRCAVTGIAIPLEELKYWSVERQEPYASPEAVLQRLYSGRTK